MTTNILLIYFVFMWSVLLKHNLIKTYLFAMVYSSQMFLFLFYFYLLFYYYCMFLFLFYSENVKHIGQLVLF